MKKIITLAIILSTFPSFSQTAAKIAEMRAEANMPRVQASIAACRRKAAKGDAKSQDALGWFFQFGVGMPQDYLKAIYWYRKAANQKLAEADSRLAEMYHKGEGVPKDDQLAAQWYQKGAKEGDPSAQYNLAFDYVAGVGVPQDYSEAYFWASLAAASTKSTSGNLSLENVLSFRDSIASDLTKSQIVIVQERARKWFGDHVSNTSSERERTR